MTQYMNFKTTAQFNPTYQAELIQIRGNNQLVRSCAVGPSGTGKTALARTLLDKEGSMPHELSSSLGRDSKGDIALGLAEEYHIPLRFPFKDYQQYCEGEPNNPIITESLDKAIILLRE